MRKIKVVNLANDDEFTFIVSFPESAYESMTQEVETLVNCYMQVHGLASQIHNPRKRDELRCRVIEGKNSYGLGDLAVRRGKGY